MAAVLLAACSDPGPYRLRLHVADVAVCEPYEVALDHAVEFWSGRGVDTFVLEDCIKDEFNDSPLVVGVPGSLGYTKDLARYSDHVPVYVVSSVAVDAGENEVAEPLAVGLPSDVVPCPGLVASTVDDPIALAHELGHLLWLQHSDAADNVMHPSQAMVDLGSLALEASQIDAAHEAFDDCARQRR